MAAYREPFPPNALREAILTGTVDDVARLLPQHSPNEMSTTGITALSTAASRGHIGIVALLLDMGADPNLANAWSMGTRMTPLHSAAIYGHVNIVRLLLNRGAILESETTRGTTALILAAAEGHEDVVAVLVGEYHADVNHAQTGSGQTPLISAVYGENFNAVRTLVEHGADVNAETTEGSTALLDAALYNLLNIATLLVQRGALVDAVDGQSGKTPLMKAAEHGYIHMTRMLLAAGADPNKEDAADWTTYKETPVTIAAQYGHVDVLKELLENGANARLEQGGRAVWLAALNGNAEIVDLLISAGADPTYRNPEGSLPRTPMAAAAEKGHVAVVELLLRRGVKYDESLAAGAIDKDVMSALRKFAWEGHKRKKSGAYPPNGVPFSDKC